MALVSQADLLAGLRHGLRPNPRANIYHLGESCQRCINLKNEISPARQCSVKSSEIFEAKGTKKPRRFARLIAMVSCHGPNLGLRLESGTATENRTPINEMKTRCTNRYTIAAKL